MPNAATLETLTIEINGNASSASAGITGLVAPLRSLARGVGTVIPALKELNKQLKELAGYASIKLPKIPAPGSSITGSGGRKSPTPKSKKPSYEDIMNAWTQTRDPVTGVITNTNTITGKTWSIDPAGFGKPPVSIPRPTTPNVDTKSIEQRRIEREARFAAEREEMKRNAEKLQLTLPGSQGVADSAKGATTGIKNVTESLKNSETASKNATSALKSVDKELRQKRTDGRVAKNGLSEAAGGAREAGESAKKAHPALAKLGKGLSSIGRIAKTMLIRTALRALMKAFGQSWQAAYAFSNAMGGSFAKSVDQAKTMLADTTTSIVQALAPAFEAIVPILYVVSNAIQFLCQGLVYLMSLIGLTSDVASANTRDVNKYYGSSASGAKKAAESNKNLLASWDELHIIQSKNESNNSNPNGSGYKPGSLKNMVNSELSAIMSIVVGEIMLAVGLILACTGHIGIGVAMMAIGATSIAKTLIVDWDYLPTEMKRTIISIMAYVGYGMLAIGLILAFASPAHLGLGIGLIALGAANIAAAVAVSWGSDVEDGVKQTLTEIMGIAGGALLAIGIILACCGQLPLGIGMIVAGGISLATAVALNWDSIVSTVQNIMTQIADWFVARWNEITVAVQMAWDLVSQWWNTNIGDPIKGVWNTAIGWIEEKFNAVKIACTLAWDTVKIWWDNSIVKPVEKAWNAAFGFIFTLFADSDTPGSIAYYATTAWEAVSIWWTGIKDTFSTAWDTTLDYLVNDVWGSTEQGGTIVGTIWDAWQTVEIWWTGIYDKVSGAWESVKTFFKNLWEGEDGKGGIVGYATKAWDHAKMWWETNVTQNVEKEGAWGGVKGFFSGLIGSAEERTGIVGEFLNMWDEIGKLWGDIITPIQEAWGSVGTWFYNNVTMPISNFFIRCVNGVIDGVNWLIGMLNSINITIPAVSLPLVGQLWGETKIGISGIALVDKLEELEPITANAHGAYGIPQGDLFIANEAGAELVGSMNGKTTVANQGQIIEGIQSGVYAAQSEQNSLLRRQNELLTRLIEKNGEIKITPSAEWGKFNQRSNEMWGRVSGR